MSFIGQKRSLDAEENNSSLFYCGENFMTSFVVPQSLIRAMATADKAVKSAKFFETLRSLIFGCSESKASLTENRISIDIITFQPSLTAYAVVYRQDYPITMFFHPMLILYANLEDHDATLNKKWFYFFLVKIIHEFSYLINPILSPSLVQQIEPIIKGGGGKKKMITPEVIIDSFKFTDIGEMMEKKLFNGLIYLKCAPGFPCKICDLIIRPHQKSRTGAILDFSSVDFEIFDNELSFLKVPLGAEYFGEVLHLPSNIFPSYSSAMEQSDNEETPDLRLIRSDDSDDELTDFPDFPIERR